MRWLRRAAADIVCEGGLNQCISTALWAAFVAVVLTACVAGQFLKTDLISSPDPSGTYTLILHGGRYAADLQNVAILDREGDPYTLELYAPAFDYKIKRGLTSEQAVQEAEKFVRSYSAVRNSQWKAIIGPDGAVIGYEVRPLYEPLESSYPDILDITYIINEKKVTARISFKPEIERAIMKEEKGGGLFRGGR